MRRGLLFCLPSVFAVLLLALVSGTQDLSSQPSSGKTVCVAVVNNHTAQSLFVERMTERLARSLSGSKVKAVAMDSSSDTSSHCGKWCRAKTPGVRLYRAHAGDRSEGSQSD